MNGRAGVAVARGEQDRLDEAIELLRSCGTPDIADIGPGVCDGIAGIGLANAHVYARTSDPRCLREVERIAESIVDLARPSTQGVYWLTSAAPTISLGFGYGISGIAFFLSEAFRFTEEGVYRSTALDALDFVIAHSRTFGPDGRSWPEVADQFGTLPYWIHGAAGIGSVALRMADRLGDPKLRLLAEQAGAASFSLFTVHPGQFMGLAGIGEFMIDLYRATSNTFWMDRALDIAGSLVCYAVHRPNGIAFAGDFGARLCCDFATGSAGVGLFLSRLRKPSPRLFYDY
jgi:hypothetical protein